MKTRFPLPVPLRAYCVPIAALFLVGGFSHLARAQSQTAPAESSVDSDMLLGDDDISLEPTADAVANQPAGATANQSADVAAGMNSPRPPWSASTPASKQRAALSAYRQANELAEKRFYATAEAKYHLAYKLWPHPAFAYNLALMQMQLGRSIDAHASLTRAVEHGADPLRNRYELAQQQIARIEGEVGMLRVRCEESGARVMLDGQLLFEAPGSFQGVVRPGAHQVTAVRRGLDPVVEFVVAAAGEELGVVLTFEYPTVEVEILYRRWTTWGPYAAVLGGTAALFAGAALSWRADRTLEDNAAQLRDLCSMNQLSGMSGCSPDDSAYRRLVDRRQRATLEQRLSYVGYAVGGTALAAGAVLMYLNREQTRTERRTLTPAALDASEETTYELRPLVAPSVLGVSASFSF